jgi:hypothetical protein
VKHHPLFAENPSDNRRADLQLLGYAKDRDSDPVHLEDGVRLKVSSMRLHLLLEIPHLNQVVAHRLLGPLL